VLQDERAHPAVSDGTACVVGLARAQHHFELSSALPSANSRSLSRPMATAKKVSS